MRASWLVATVMALQAATALAAEPSPVEAAVAADRHRPVLARGGRTAELDARAAGQADLALVVLHMLAAHLDRKSVV